MSAGSNARAAIAVSVSSVRWLRVAAKLVEGLVNGSSVCVDGDACEVEVGGGDCGDGGAVCVVVWG
jgi:hypothetical protein